MSDDPEDPEDPAEAGDGADVEEPADDREEPAGDAEDQPDLNDDDLVDVPEEMAEQVVGETADDDSDEAGDGGDTDGGDDTDDDGGSNPLTTGTSVGDVYCNALGMAATMARDRKGSGVDDREETMDEYGDLARQCELDDFVDEYVAARSGTDELSPGQGIVVGTLMFGMMVMVDDPALADGLAEEVSG